MKAWGSNFWGVPVICSTAFEVVLTRTMVWPSFLALLTRLIGATLELAQMSSVPSSLAQCSQRKVPAGTTTGSVPTLCHLSMFSCMRSFVLALWFMGISMGVVEPG